VPANEMPMIPKPINVSIFFINGLLALEPARLVSGRLVPMEPTESPLPAGFEPV
jgi:hypothetical protein